MVVDNDDIELECCLLCQRGDDSVADSLLTVVDRYDNRSLDRELLLMEIRRYIVVGIYQSSNGCEMRCRGTLHLHLDLAVAWVDIVELPLAAVPCVKFLLGIQCLVEMEYVAFCRQPQPEGIQAGILIIGCLTRRILLDEVCAHEYNGAEVEIVSQCALLIVYDGMVLTFAIADGVIIAIYHSCPGINGSPKHTFP